MGMEIRRDWKADVHLASSNDVAGIEPRTAPAEENRGAKLGVAALAVAGVLTIGWILWLCHLIRTFVGSLF
jgi:hypothetical protein